GRSWSPRSPTISGDGEAVTPPPGRRRGPVTSAQSERFLELVADGWPIADAAWAAGRHRARVYDLRQADRAFDVAWRAAAVRGELVAERAARDTGGVARAHEDDFRTRNEADLAHGDGDRGSAASSNPSAASSADRGSRPGERGSTVTLPSPSLEPEKSEKGCRVWQRFACCCSSA